MDKYNLKDALLFISRGDTHEILIETNQRTRPDVQSNLQELLNLYPDIIPKVVSLSELQEAGQDDENKGPKERIIHLKNLQMSVKVRRKFSPILKRPENLVLQIFIF